MTESTIVMAQFQAEGIDTDSIQDFIAEYEDLYQAAEKTILDLEHHPEDSELLNALFRAIHTIKGNCGYLAITPLIELLQELESLLHLIRTGDMVFSPLVGDITLLIMDRCSTFLAQLQQYFSVNYDAALFKLIETQLKDVFTSASELRPTFLSHLLMTLDPSTVGDVALTDTQNSALVNGFSDDLQFVYEAALTTQNRTSYWHGRLDRVISLLLKLNDSIENGLDHESLIAAVCIHDISMAFLPSSLLNKPEQLTQQEFLQMREHVPLAVRMAKNFQYWDQTRQILEDHHEHLDGSGYPYGKQGAEIYIGAQMLAIVHAYEAITHGYSRDISRKRPLMRAVMELNRHIDYQFNRSLVEAFMKVIRP
ncbi:MAG: response regulator RpfG family c-di-GMP phosphodiesterase [Reinekea sp.]|jgi:response regulator RpfG family c-di-GMP phosphodiesterase|uniref:HD-GYP domain-containing protein n=2 Tax=Reinekea sp. TaxID=1970455 RepID=UPI00398A46FE